VARTNYNAARAARQIDALVNRSQTRLYTHSPNDVLVQIALPLILILAISTRLMMVAYNMHSQRDTGPAVMELWKQQVILRIDRVLEQWEADANLAVFSDFSRVQWQHTWPGDPQYQQLCRKAQELNEPAALRAAILTSALASQKAATDDAMAAVVPGQDLALAPGSAEAAYAEDYITQRLAQWRDRVETLHWETVGHIASRLPLGPQAGIADARAQLQQIAIELETRGYPLITAVRTEYGAEETLP
jgi:hypothetical protein